MPCGKPKVDVFSSVVHNQPNCPKEIMDIFIMMALNGLTFLKGHVSTVACGDNSIYLNKKGCSE